MQLLDTPWLCKESCEPWNRGNFEHGLLNPSRGSACRSRAAERGCWRVVWKVSLWGGKKKNHSPALGLCLAALHRLRVPLRGPGPAGGHRQWLRLPAGPVQPSPQLPQPRVLPREAHVQRGKCGVGAARSHPPLHRGLGQPGEEQLLH